MSRLKTAVVYFILWSLYQTRLISRFSNYCYFPPFITFRYNLTLLKPQTNILTELQEKQCHEYKLQWITTQIKTTFLEKPLMVGVFKRVLSSSCVVGGKFLPKAKHCTVVAIIIDITVQILHKFTDEVYHVLLSVDSFVIISRQTHVLYCYVKRF